MATTPNAIAKQIRWDIGDALEFSAELLEEVNAHYIAAALRAFNIQEVELACSFLRLEEDIFREGELTPALREKANDLMRQLSEAQGQ